MCRFARNWKRPTMQAEATWLPNFLPRIAARQWSRRVNRFRCRLERTLRSRLFYRYADGGAGNPGGADLDRRHSWAYAGRHAKIHLISVHRARITDGAQDFRGLSIHRYSNWRVDHRQRTRWEGLAWG